MSMTDEEKRDDEGAEEAIEDLEAPADAQGPVAGVTTERCAPPSCTGVSHCAGKTTVVFEQ
jgi:hypothetical protein